MTKERREGKKQRKKKKKRMKKSKQSPLLSTIYIPTHHITPHKM